MIVLKSPVPSAPEQAVEKVDRRRQPRSLEVRAKISATMRERGIRPDGKETVFFKPRPLKEEVLRTATVAEIMWLLQATPS